MRTLNRRERFLGMATGLVLVGAFLGEGVIGPRWRRCCGLEQEVDRLQVSLMKMQANMRLKDQIEKRYEGLKGLIRVSGSPSQEMARFAQLLTRLYGPLDVQTRSVQPLPDVDEGFYRKFALRIEMVGRVEAVAAFLGAVAEASDPIRVERVDLICKDRADLVTASIIVTKVVTTGQEAAAPETQVAGRW